MKKKIKIVFEIEADYPEIEKETKRLIKSMKTWIKDTALYQEFLVPNLYNNKNRCFYDVNAKVKVKGLLNNKTVINHTWYETEDDF